MTTPERVSVRRRRQILDDETGEQREPQHKDAWVKDFIARLAGVIRNVGGKK